jgi:phospho-N-acetylmuramoyl-pentapeptide-transferase
MLDHVFLLFLALIFSFLLTYPLVRIICYFKIGQAIREEGPKTHMSKAGTPTMGGIGFISTIIILSLIFIDFQFDLRYLAIILLTLGFAAVGFADDLIKILRQQNQGLTFWQKMILQLFLAGVFSLFLISLGQHLSVGAVLKILGFSFGPLYFLLSVFIVVGTANATNLTDGLNGLLAGTAATAFFSFGLLSSKLEIPEAAAFCFLAAGAIAMFLYFNFPKAKIFMGDVGSLAIGAALAGIAVVLHKELLLALIGGVFLIEALSVIIQVVSFKYFKKRVFKMTPIHHHFELMGFKEPVIVVMFWLAGIVLGVVAVLMS